MTITHQLVIALRPGHAAEADRLERELRAIDGVVVTGAFRGRIQATASDSALAEIRRCSGDIAHVEVQARRELPE